MEERDFPYEFDPERRKIARVYSKQQLYLGVFQGIFLSVVFLAVVYASSFSHWLELYISDILSNTSLQGYWLIAVIYVIVLMTLLFLLGMPLSFYGGYKLEHDYKLSNQGLGDWIKDQFKSLFISLIFTTPLILGVFYLGRTYPDRWWLFAGLALFVVMGVLSNVSHLLLLPLFFKTEVMNDEELADRLKTLAKENGVTGVDKVIKVHASKKTEKANAGFAGMGKTKRIYLFDTLLEKFHEREIEGVVAHEMGHYIHRDVPRYILLEGAIIFPVFLLVDRLFTTWASFDNIHHLPLFLLILYGLYSFIDPLTLAYSRYRERKADEFALDTMGDPIPIISAFKRLADIDLAETEPGKIVEILYYSHPAISRRIEMARSWLKGPSH